MNTFFTSLPAILGIVAFVIYHILKKSVTEDPIIKTVVEKVRKQDPSTYESYEGLDKNQKEQLLKTDLNFRNKLSIAELRLLDKTLKRQFQTNLYVYSLCGFLLLFGVCLFVYQSSIPKTLFIDNIQIQNTDPAARNIVVDLDPLNVTWTSTGQDEEVFVALENAATGKQTKKIRVQASEGKVEFDSNRYDNYEKILSNRQPYQSNRIRALIFSRKECFKSKEFEVKVGVRLYCVASLPNKIEFFATIDQVMIENYHYLPKLILFRDAHFQNKVPLIGKEYAPSHKFIVPNPESIYPGSYILTYDNEKDDRIVRTEVDFSDFYKIKHKTN